MRVMSAVNPHVLLRLPHVCSTERAAPTRCSGLDVRESSYKNFAVMTAPTVMSRVCVCVFPCVCSRVCDCACDCVYVPLCDCGCHCVFAVA